jgi:hypothetical protein
MALEKARVSQFSSSKPIVIHQERKVHAVPRSSRRTLLKWLPNHPHTFPKIIRDDRSYADARGFVIIAKADFP